MRASFRLNNLFNIVDNIKECGQHNIVQSCFQQPSTTRDFLPNRFKHFFHGSSGFVSTRCNNNCGNTGHFGTSYDQPANTGRKWGRVVNRVKIIMGSAEKNRVDQGNQNDRYFRSVGQCMNLHLKTFREKSVIIPQASQQIV